MLNLTDFSDNQLGRDLGPGEVWVAGADDYIARVTGLHPNYKLERSFVALKIARKGRTAVLGDGIYEVRYTYNRDKRRTWLNVVGGDIAFEYGSIDQVVGTFTDDNTDEPAHSETKTCWECGRAVTFEGLGRGGDWHEDPTGRDGCYCGC